MILSAHQPQYIPWLGYFDKIARSDVFVFLDNVQYKPREYQNRNKIRTKDGWLWLSVPVISKGKGRQKIGDVLIDNERPWRRQHLNSLYTWYGNAKYFSDYIGFFEDVYSKKWRSLVELNVHIISLILEQLDIRTNVYFESRLEINTTKTERIIDICKKLKADTYLSGQGGKEYMEEEKFSKAGIRLLYQEFSHPAYRQCFMKDKDDFISHMSILDLLFNEGPRSREILKF